MSIFSLFKKDETPKWFQTASRIASVIDTVIDNSGLHAVAKGSILFLKKDGKIIPAFNGGHPKNIDHLPSSIGHLVAIVHISDVKESAAFSGAPKVIERSMTSSSYRAFTEMLAQGIMREAAKTIAFETDSIF